MQNGRERIIDGAKHSRTARKTHAGIQIKFSIQYNCIFIFFIVQTMEEESRNG
jgi:hypothetical protein